MRIVVVKEGIAHMNGRLAFFISRDSSLFYAAVCACVFTRVLRAKLQLLKAKKKKDTNHGRTQDKR